MRTYNIYYFLISKGQVTPTTKASSTGVGIAYPGGTVSHTIKLFSPPQSSAKYELVISASGASTVGIVSLTSVHLVGIGSNLPCTNPDDISFTYSSSDGNATYDSVTCHLGQLSNTATGGALEQEPNAVWPSRDLILGRR